ncbi:hypothetical protein PIB30_097981, partial [Stylosanthes scabra]|nr:hypothetical protein [Stylosanthes scabra]
MMDSDDIRILQSFEDIVSLEANEPDGPTRNKSTNISTTNTETIHWEEPTQEDVRVMEQVRDIIRNQLAQEMNA